MNLEEIRTEIDALDKELLALFERRMDLCRDVALYKKEHNLPVFQPEREEKLLDKIEQAASPDRKHAARTLFSVILDISKQLQSRILAKMEIDPIFPVPNFSAAQKNSERGKWGRFPRSEFFCCPENRLSGNEWCKLRNGFSAVLPWQSCHLLPHF